MGKARAQGMCACFSDEIPHPWCQAHSWQELQYVASELRSFASRHEFHYGTDLRAQQYAILDAASLVEYLAGRGTYNHPTSPRSGLSNASCSGPCGSCMLLHAIEDATFVSILHL